MPKGEVFKTWIGWSVVIAIGLYSFVLSKRSIDRNRYENMKIRERIRNAPCGDRSRILKDHHE